MQMSSNILVFTSLICFGHAEVVLKQGKIQTVAFEGNELIIQLENPQRQNGAFKMCFGSTPNVRYELCPPGYGGAWINLLEGTRTYKLNRQGKLGRDLTIGGGIVFNADGTINVLVVGMPYGAIVKLLNAEIPVATTTSAPTEKDTSNKATTGIIVTVIILILSIFIIGGTVLYFCWYRKRSNRQTQTTGSQVYLTVDEVRKPDKTLPKMAVKPYVQPPLKRQALMPSTTTSTTRASEDKPQLVTSTKPEPNASVALNTNCVSLIHASAQMSTPDAVSMQKSGKAKASKKSRRHVSTISKTMRSDKPVEPSSLFPGYVDDPVSKSQAESSRCETDAV
uniref:Mid2 domain-containing protein n=1 Tax=Panagrellus redivivus TaxID=6233 RepID=A0A7E4W5V1_PANRE